MNGVDIGSEGFDMLDLMWLHGPKQARGLMLWQGLPLQI